MVTDYKLTQWESVVLATGVRQFLAQHDMSIVAMGEIFDIGKSSMYRLLHGNAHRHLADLVWIRMAEFNLEYSSAVIQ